MPIEHDDVIEDDTVNHRFVLRREGAEAELVYRRRGDRLVLVHTGVPDELSGHGIGGRLVEAAVAAARREQLVVVPRCPFAREWLDAHPDVAATVTIEPEQAAG